MKENKRITKLLQLMIKDYNFISLFISFIFMLNYVNLRRNRETTVEFMPKIVEDYSCNKKYKPAQDLLVISRSVHLTFGLS